MKTGQEFEYLLVTHCAPTLAGLKDGSMFSYSYKNNESLRIVCGFWRKSLESKGLGIEILKRTEKKALIYVYWKARLDILLDRKDIRKTLDRCGYEYESVRDALEMLKEHMKESECFPHEIGIFLGYPLEDVLGFIENRGKNCAMCGYWKVYCNQSQAEKTFALYTRCRELYRILFEQGIHVLQMIAV